MTSVVPTPGSSDGAAMQAQWLAYNTALNQGIFLDAMEHVKIFAIAWLISTFVVMMTLLVFAASLKACGPSTCIPFSKALDLLCPLNNEKAWADACARRKASLKWYTVAVIAQLTLDVMGGGFFFGYIFMFLADPAHPVVLVLFRLFCTALFYALLRKILIVLMRNTRYGVFAFTDRPATVASATTDAIAAVAQGAMIPVVARALIGGDVQSLHQVVDRFLTQEDATVEQAVDLAFRVLVMSVEVFCSSKLNALFGGSWIEYVAVIAFVMEYAYGDGFWWCPCGRRPQNAQASVGNDSEAAAAPVSKIEARVSKVKALWRSHTDKVTRARLSESDAQTV